MPVLTIAVSGRRDFREVTEIARRKIKERLEPSTGSAPSRWSAAGSGR